MSLSRGPSGKFGPKRGSSGSLKDLVRRGSKTKDVYTTVSEGLKGCYNKSLRPFEEATQFHNVHSPAMEDADFTSKPAVLLVGQYSTGKTTFIRYLVGEDFPGCRIGPEPTTDRFHVIMGQKEDDLSPSIIPGNALVVDPKYPFRPLSKFGNAFLNRFQCSHQKNPLLKEITLIDTPGILSGEKQSVDRGYDYVEVLEWFAARVDVVLLLFDAHKLDISDELRRAIDALSRWDDKIHIVLNKADGVDNQALMRVYGALMWSLGKVLICPEVPRVYIGSWWDKQLDHATFRQLFELEEQDLFAVFRALPKQAALRKLNDFIKRARLARVLSLVVAELAASLPVLRKENAKIKLLNNLDKVVDNVQRKHGTITGDLPPMEKLREALRGADWTKFKQVSKSQLERLDTMLGEDMPKLVSLMPREDTHVCLNGPIEAANNNATPFSSRSLYSDLWSTTTREGWPVEANLVLADQWKETFRAAAVNNGKITGAVAKVYMVESKLPNSVLSKVWGLADIDKNGLLDEEEFCLAMYLIQYKLEGRDLPSQLPPHLIPPSRRVKEMEKAKEMEQAKEMEKTMEMEQAKEMEQVKEMENAREMEQVKDQEQANDVVDEKDGVEEKELDKVMEVDVNLEESQETNM